MKALLKIAKFLIFLQIAGLILTCIVIPLTMTFTTNDRSASLDFFIDNLIEFLPLAPFLILALSPTLALKSYASFKLDDLSAPTLKKHLSAFSVAEITAIILTIITIIDISTNNHASLL